MKEKPIDLEATRIEMHRILEEEYFYGGFARDSQFGMSRKLFGKMARETKAITIGPDHKYMMDGVPIIIIDYFDRDYAYCIINGVFPPVEKKCFGR